tara:strand:+ start:70891 stop:71514 length:624 start_codon:yes stop_codon:yes gene_type:complete
MKTIKNRIPEINISISNPKRLNYDFNTVYQDESYIGKISLTINSENDYSPIIKLKVQDKVKRMNGEIQIIPHYLKRDLLYQTIKQHEIEIEKHYTFDQIKKSYNSGFSDGIGVSNRGDIRHNKSLNDLIGMSLNDILNDKDKYYNFDIDQEDLKILYIHTGLKMEAWKFSYWVRQTKEAYAEYINKNIGDKSFSQWVNGQIIALQTI